jgi:hypothetical protein
MNMILYARNFSVELAAPNVDYEVKRYSHAAIGGPLTATITVNGDELDLWGLIERIRCPIEIYSDQGECVWWGYIADVALDLNNISVGISVDSMFNYIAVAYSELAAGVEGTGARATTAWAGNADSNAEYGYRELLQTTSGATSGYAVAARDMLLSQKMLPVPTITWQAGSGSGQATLTCRGWFDTLDWRYYANANSTAVDNAAQVTAITTAKGQFFTSIDQDVTAGISTSEYRDGDATALYEIGELLKLGTSNSRRMLATVDKTRRLRIYEEPTSASPFFLLKDGSLNNPFDVPIRKELCSVAIWAKLKDVIPLTVDVSKFIDPTLIFIEENEYDVQRDMLKPLPRGIESPFDLARISDG